MPYKITIEETREIVSEKYPERKEGEKIERDEPSTNHFTISRAIYTQEVYEINLNNIIRAVNQIQFKKSK